MPRNLTTSLTNASGCSQKNRCPEPWKSSTRAPADPVGEHAARCAGRRRCPRCLAGSASAPRSRRATPGKVVPAAACACQPAGSGGFATRRAKSSSTSASGASAAERVLDEPPQRDLGRERRRLLEEPDRHLGHRHAVGAAGRRAAEHEPVDALGRGDRDLLGDHPAEARADHVRALDAGLVEHLQPRRRPSRAPCTAPAGLSLSPMPRLSNDSTRKRSASARADGLPAPARRSRGPGSAAAARPSPCSSHAILITASPPAGAAAVRGRRTRPMRRRCRPAAKKTTRMKSTPSTKSGCCERRPQDRRQLRDGVRARRASLSRWSSVRVEDAADQRAPARAGAADHDHHEQRQREVRRRSPSGVAPPSSSR